MAKIQIKSEQLTYPFIFHKTLVAKISIIFSDQAHSSLKKRGFAKIQHNNEPSTPTGVELQVTAHDQMCGLEASTLSTTPTEVEPFYRLYGSTPLGSDV